MPDLERRIRTAHASNQPEPRTTRLRFVFGGVSFEVLADESVAWAVPANYQRHVREADDQALIIADVICSVSGDRALPQPTEAPRNGLFTRRVGGVVQLSAAELQAELSEIGPARYVCTARVAPGESGVRALLLGLCSVLAQLAGGVVLHAAALEWHGRALLFIGPSGAGKSTAAALVPGAPVFAFDRVIVLGTAERGFLAISLPGGTPVSGARESACLQLPIGAILRVRQATGAPVLQPLRLGAQWFALRESSESSDQHELSEAAERAESERLQLVLQLCEAVPVGEIQTVLGRSLETLLQERLPQLRAAAADGGERAATPVRGERISPDAIPLKSERTATRVLAGEALVLVLDRRELHRLNEVGTRVFELCDGARSVHEITDQILREFVVPASAAARDVERFISELVHVGALRLQAEA